MKNVCNNCMYFEWKTICFSGERQGKCTNEKNWLPSRGDMEVSPDDCCKEFTKEGGVV